MRTTNLEVVALANLETPDPDGWLVTLHEDEDVLFEFRMTRNDAERDGWEFLPIECEGKYTSTAAQEKVFLMAIQMIGWYEEILDV